MFRFQEFACHKLVSMMARVTDCSWLSLSQLFVKVDSSGVEMDGLGIAMDETTLFSSADKFSDGSVDCIAAMTCCAIIFALSSWITLSGASFFPSFFAIICFYPLDLFS